MTSSNLLTESLNNFTFTLYNKLSGAKNENFFISPFSISTALAMCYIGAKNETAAQLKSLLKFNNLNDDDILRFNSELMVSLNTQIGDQVTLNTANKIYPNEGFNIRKEYVDSIVKNFHSDVQQLNFSDAEGSAKIINDWVSLKTKEKINNLVPSDALSPATRLVLVNAIYFKGNWLQKFNKESTIKEDFTLADGSKQKVDMMRLINKKWKAQNLEELNAQVCEFPYAGEKVSMTIILPHVGVKLEDVESKLNGGLIKEIFNKGYKQEINVFIPKFKLEYSQELSGPLKDLGAPNAFNGALADFSGITSDPVGVYISKVIHKAMVEVNEEGTEAAAATAILMLKSCSARPREPLEFRCNRPFLFLIHDNIHKNILFLGKYSKPE